jgi:hypothetical protein
MPSLWPRVLRNRSATVTALGRAPCVESALEYPPVEISEIQRRNSAFFWEGHVRVTQGSIARSAGEGNEHTNKKEAQELVGSAYRSLDGDRRFISARTSVESGQPDKIWGLAVPQLREGTCVPSHLATFGTPRTSPRLSVHLQRPRTADTRPRMPMSQTARAARTRVADEIGL